MLTLNITAACQVGCVRNNNEDMILVDNLFLRDEHISTTISIAESDRCLIALADGMGGHNSGDVASDDTLHNLQFFFNDLPANLQPSDFNEMICEWLDSINHIIDAKGHTDKRFLGMGTTLVAVAYYNKEFYWMNCGDSRLYRLHEGKLSQVSTDHSLSNLLGQKEHTNVITNCIGGGCKTSYIDMVQCTPDILPGDILLLCSDGLSDMIADETIERMLNEGENASALCLEAEKAGGYDNVSAIVIKIED